MPLDHELRAVLEALREFGRALDQHTDHPPEVRRAWQHLDHQLAQLSLRLLQRQLRGPHDPRR